MNSTPTSFRPGLAAGFVVAFLALLVFPDNSTAQNNTVFVDGFYSYQTGTLARGCGDMTSGSWRWSSHHSNACYSAGWGIREMDNANNKLFLWGGGSTGGGDCTVSAQPPELKALSDYSVRAKITPLEVRGNAEGCLYGMAGVAGRVSEGDAFCTGYLLAVLVNSGASDCGESSSLQLLCNNRGHGCGGSESMTLLASQDIKVSTDPSGKLTPPEEYVLELRFEGAAVWGALWTVDEWKAGGDFPLAEVRAEDDTYSSGTIGLYQGSCHVLFDDVVLSVGGQTPGGPSDPLVAEVYVDPDRISTKSSGRYVTCYIELPGEYDPWEIDLATVMLNNTIPAELSPTEVADHDHDAVSDRMIKFDRQELFTLVSVASGSNAPSSGGLAFSMPPSGDQEVELEIKGGLNDGTLFSGVKTVVVTSQGDGGRRKNRPGLRMPRGPLTGEPMIGFELPADGQVTVSVYDAAGRLVRSLESGFRRAGSYETSWDCRTDDGRCAAMGVYFVRLQQGAHAAVGKMILVN